MLYKQFIEFVIQNLYIYTKLDEQIKYNKHGLNTRN